MVVMKMLKRTYVGPFGGTWGTKRGAGWRLVLVLAMLAVITTPVSADGGLTGAVSAAYFPRTVDAGLHSIAHQRALEISACPTCMNHNLMRAGTSEVLAFNFGSADPIGDAVRGWQASPLHNGILSNGSLGSIGCAQAVVGTTSYFACVLAPGGAAVALAPAPAPAAPAPAAPGAPAAGTTQLALPDTSTPVIVRAGASWTALV
jgi:hypothetical protein